MVNEKIRILIVGGGAVATALARYIKNFDYVEKIYATSGKSDFYETIDIREDDLTGLLMFALKNEISLTIPISEKTLGADIVSFFQSNGQNIFGPSKDSCDFMLNKIQCKKFLYKIHAQTPKFAMYNKTSAIIDYLKNSNFPVIISTAQNSVLQDEKMVCPTLKSASDFVEKLFLKGETDVLIEDYTFGHNFTAYYITDGYSAIPFNIVGNYKFLGKDGGIYTDGAGCYCPDYKVNSTVMTRIDKIVSDILTNLDNSGHSYTGIIGVECVLTGENNFVVTEIKPFLRNHDARAILNLCQDDLIKIFTSCINGFFSDEYEKIKTNDYSSVSLCFYSDIENKEIEGLDDLEDVDFIKIKEKDSIYYSQIGMNFSLTKTASTLSRAKKYLSEELEEINFDRMKYLKEICAKIEQ
ncbi:hypothetical protein IJ674_04905 [bacterium]|nr:hypothetical protein [bacterium]